jgi:hypothetical protein
VWTGSGAAGYAVKEVKGAAKAAGVTAGLRLVAVDGQPLLRPERLDKQVGLLLQRLSCCGRSNWTSR